MTRALFAILGLLALPQPAPPHPVASPAPSPAARLFAFHNNPWLNLHHFVRAVARGMPADARLTAEEKEAWDAAVALYRRGYAERDLLFDQGMVHIKHELRKARGDTLAGVALDRELAAALERAMPVYRRHWWPAHEAANRAWISAVEPLLDRYGPELARRVAGAYDRTWPTQPVEVDVSVQAGQYGAYTTADPTHITISSQDPDYQERALEMLFHEASHAWDAVLEEGIERAARATGLTPPRQLWHAVLFFTAGESTRRVLAAAGETDYLDMGTHRGNYDRACRCHAQLAEHWGRRLDGRATIDEALTALVKAVRAPRATASPPPAK